MRANTVDHRSTSADATPDAGVDAADFDSAVRVRSSATVRLARWSATHKWRAIAMWLIFVATCIAIGQASGLTQVTDLEQSVGQSGRAAHLLHDSGLVDPQTEDVLISARGTREPDAALAARAATAITARMTALPQVESVDRPVTSANGRGVLVVVTMRGDPETAGERVAPLLASTASVQRQYPALRVEQAGGASLDNAVNTQVGRDLSTAADVSLPVTLVILLIAFGAIIAAGVPVLLALSAVGSAVGLSTLASHVIPDSGSTSSMILLMGMAVGIDYSLFYVKRVREERSRGRGQVDAIEIAARTSGHAVIVSGLAVIVSMLGLFLADDVVFASLATGSIIVVAVAVLGSVTVLPAALAALGRGIDRPRVPVLWRLAAQTREPRLWPALLAPTVRHPGRTLVVSVLALIALAVPALGLKLHSDSAQSLPRSIPAVQSFDRVNADFPANSTTVDVVVGAPAAAAAAVNDRLATLARDVVGNPLFAVPAGDRAATRASADATVHELTLSVPFDAESTSAKRALIQLRTRLLPTTVGRLAGATWAVGGETASDVDLDNHLTDRMPWVVGFVLALTMLMTALVFRSVVLALVTAAVNLLSAGAAFGVLVLTFQHTWAQGLLDFRSTGAVINWIPLFTFAVLFGLSMDYHVFVLSRIREAVQAGLPMREAVRVGTIRSAGAVTSAAVVMVSVFAIFASLHMVEMKELGVGLAVAVLVDALVVRVIVLPSLLILLGRAAWWPSKLARSRRGQSASERIREPVLTRI